MSKYTNAIIFEAVGALVKYQEIFKELEEKKKEK
jgi:hypothetical protein